ncbi:MAG TPA: hypothetical protein VK395_38070 [Gemmataceae bacterium]|nr:hypothetical protein [Gemmataceae bacterium]
MRPPPYPFSEFLGHFDDIHGILDRERKPGYPWPFERTVIRVSQYFKPLYADSKEMMYKMGRFYLIMNYLSDHVNEFDQGDFAVYGSERVGGLVAEHLLRAVHEVFTTKDLGELGRGPSPRDVMQIAERLRESDVTPS